MTVAPAENSQVIDVKNQTKRLLLFLDQKQIESLKTHFSRWDQIRASDEGRERSERKLLMVLDTDELGNVDVREVSPVLPESVKGHFYFA